MRIKIEYYCHDCNYSNRTNLGQPGFQSLETNFDFSDAILHKITNPEHFMKQEISIYGDNDDEY